MEQPQKTFREELDNIEKKFFLLMQQYNKYFVLSRTSKNKSDKKYFLNTETNIDTLMNEFNQLRNSIHQTNKQMKLNFENDDKIIKKLKKIKEELEEREKDLVLKTGASGPFKKQVKEGKKKSNLEFTYYSLSVLGIGYLIYSTVRS